MTTTKPTQLTATDISQHVSALKAATSRISNDRAQIARIADVLKMRRDSSTEHKRARADAIADIKNLIVVWNVRRAELYSSHWSTKRPKKAARAAAPKSK